MTVSKSWPHPADLDELEEELRSVATTASRDRHDADVLAELAKKVGRDTPTPAATLRGAVVKFRPRSQGAAPLEFDLESEIKKAVRTDYSATPPQAQIGDQAGSAPQSHEPRVNTAADFGSQDAAATPHAEDAWHDHDPDHDFVHEVAHDLDHHHEHEHHHEHDAHDAAWPATPVPEAPHGTSRMRRVVLPLALALTVSTAVVGLGIGGIALIRGNQPGPIPAPAQPAEAASQQSASAEAKSAEASAALPAAAAASPRDTSAEIASSPASSQLTAPGPGASAPDAGPQAATPQPGAAPTTPPQDAAKDAAPSPNAVTASGTQAPSQTPSQAPSQSQSQTSGQGASLGTPRRVATVSVKPDGSIAPVDSPLPPVRPALLAATAPSTDAKPPAEAAHAKPAVGANAARNDKTTTPPETSPSVVASNQQPPEAQPPEPPSVTNVLRKVIEGGNAPQPAAPPAPAAKPIVGGVTLKLASSTTEHDAQMTLAKLQKQFPGALQGAAVHRDDMGKDGVFYRVRVGPLARDAANKLCAQLKAGGTSCTVPNG